MKRVICWAVLLAMAGASAWSQSITTEGDIETDGQLVSKAALAPPLVVSSQTAVRNLNADFVDGIHGTDLALDADLQRAEVMLAALQAQVDALGLALVPRTGQTTCYDAAGAVVTCGTGIGEGQDGHLTMGVQWPTPRFTINEVVAGVPDGTVTDNLTGLIWLADADCIGTQSWADALTQAAALFDGCSDCGGTNDDCGLADGSIAGEWRLPNLRELQSLVHYGVSNPALPNTAGTGQWAASDPFSGVVSDNYWSSTTYSSVTTFAWYTVLGSGAVEADVKTLPFHVWPVRGGQ